MHPARFALRGEPIENLELGLRLRERLTADYPQSRVRLVPYLFSAEEDQEIEAAESESSW
jgi:hypothetical protein